MINYKIIIKIITLIALIGYLFTTNSPEVINQIITTFLVIVGAGIMGKSKD